MESPVLAIALPVVIPASLLTFLLGSLLWVRLNTVWSEERLAPWLQLAGLSLITGPLAAGLYAIDPAGQPIQPVFAVAVLAALGWWVRLRGWTRDLA
ncbi:MAG: hypothetical protein WCL53_06810 [Chloroflexota bacterium]